MPPPAQEFVVRALSTTRETALRTQAPHPLEKSLRPTNGLLAPDEVPAGIMGAMPVGALSGSPQVPFERHLRDVCDDLAARFGRTGGPRLTCEAADEALSTSAATVFALIVEVLVTDAFVHGFPPPRGGRIAVSFTAGQEAWQLTVDDSSIAVRSHGDPRDLNLAIARQLVLQVGGRLALPKVTGGTRCIATLPRPSGEGIDFGHRLAPRRSSARQLRPGA